MKLWSIKKEDGTIYVVNCIISPDFLLQGNDTVTEIQPEDLPERAFRNEWKDDNGTLKVDLPKAREKRLADIRAERDKKLAETDAEWVEKSSKGEDLTALNAKKQALRDLPAAAETDLSSKMAASTIKAYDPSWP